LLVAAPLAAGYLFFVGLVEAAERALNRNANFVYDRDVYEDKLAATNRLMATLQADFAAAQSAGRRLRTGRYVGATVEADGGDQSVAANLRFEPDGRVTGNGRDGIDGTYTLAGRYFEGRCAWVETYRDGVKVAVTGIIPKWPGDSLELSFVSSLGVTGSASLRRVTETSGRAAAMHGAAAPVLAVALAGAAVFAPHPAYAKGGGHGGGGHGGHGGHSSSSSHWSRECEAGNQVACTTELVGDLRDTVLLLSASIGVSLYLSPTNRFDERLVETKRLMVRLQDDFAAAQSDKGLFRTGRYEGSTAETDGGDQSVVADLRFEDGLVTGSGVDGVCAGLPLQPRADEVHRHPGAHERRRKSQRARRAGGGHAHASTNGGEQGRHLPRQPSPALLG